MGFRRGPKIITDGLVLALDAGSPRSYPGTGTTWSDLSTSNNNGTLTNSPTFSSNNGGSIVFDGANDYVNIGVNKSCNRFTGDFAISVWVNRTNTGGTFGNIIGDYYTNSTANALEWQLMMSNTAQLNLYNVTGGYIISNTASGFSSGVWINVVVSRIGSTITMYANTNSIATATNTTTFGSSTGNLNIGIDGNNSSEPFTGNIASVLIYKNKGLTLSEVQQNYNTIKKRFGL
jgi:hypothetical protein